MFSIYKYLPEGFKKVLFGDRKQFGYIPNEKDPCWQEWSIKYVEFYNNTQNRSIGAIVNNSGYKILKKINMQDKVVLEIGPGKIKHIKYWNKKPSKYYIADNQKIMLEQSSRILKENDINFTSLYVDKEWKELESIEDGSFDIILSFYSLEHLYPLSNYIEKLYRLLKKDGLLVTAIPAEGGLAWGLGRTLTSRRWLKSKTKINPDKIICWEHPNFAEHIITTINKKMKKKRIYYWPFRIPLIDLNLVIKVIYQK